MSPCMNIFVCPFSVVTQEHLSGMRPRVGFLGRGIYTSSPFLDNAKLLPKVHVLMYQCVGALLTPCPQRHLIMSSIFISSIWRQYRRSRRINSQVPEQLSYVDHHLVFLPRSTLSISLILVSRWLLVRCLVVLTARIRKFCRT